jgi:hypothetical protein
MGSWLWCEGRKSLNSLWLEFANSISPAVIAVLKSNGVSAG